MASPMPVVPKSPSKKRVTAKRVTAKTENVSVKDTPKNRTAASSDSVGSIRVRQTGFETVINFDNNGALRKAWNDLAMRVQNGQSVQIGEHIFVGALQATIIEGKVPVTRATRKAHRKAEARARLAKAQS
jgi:hypothetical protein